MTTCLSCYNCRMHIPLEPSEGLPQPVVCPHCNAEQRLYIEQRPGGEGVTVYVDKRLYIKSRVVSAADTAALDAAVVDYGLDDETVRAIADGLGEEEI